MATIYKLIVKLTGEVDPETGYLFDLKKLKDLIRSEVTDRFDHRNLNLDVEEFKTLNPTAENIAYVIWHALRKHIQKELELSIVLYENRKKLCRISWKIIPVWKTTT